MDRQYVGIDFHRRRSVLVRKSAAGEKLSSVRVANDPWALAAVIADAGPERRSRRPMAGIGSWIGSGAGRDGASREPSGLRGNQCHDDRSKGNDKKGSSDNHRRTRCNYQS
jgi:hypothetical protein